MATLIQRLRAGIDVGWQPLSHADCVKVVALVEAAEAFLDAPGYQSDERDEAENSLAEALVPFTEDKK